MPRRITNPVLEADKDALAALETITDYDPRIVRYNVASAQAALAAMTQKQNAEAQAEAALAAARDGAAQAEIEFHDIILGAKEQVRAQYGSNSNEVQALGLKKKSERKRPVRRITLARAA